jgi:hypothetical protein
MKPHLIEKLNKQHFGNVSLNIHTFRSMKEKAKFTDKEFGEWWATPNHVVHDGSGHPNRKKRNISQKLTKFNNIKIAIDLALKNEGKCLSLEIKNCRTKLLWECKLGHSWYQNLNHIKFSNSWCPHCKFSKAAKSSAKNFYILNHWKDGSEIVCQGSWEKKVVDFLNERNIYYRWQCEIFTMPDGRTYRPDAFLVNENKWVEIKGYFRDDAEEKWNWFHKEYPNSELWNKEKLKQKGIL